MLGQRVTSVTAITDKPNKFGSRIDPRTFEDLESNKRVVPDFDIRLRLNDQDMHKGPIDVCHVCISIPSCKDLVTGIARNTVNQIVPTQG